MEIIVVVAWIFFAVTAGSLAGNRGRSALLWALFGMFIGPFAWIVAALPPVESETTKTAGRQSVRRCPYCDEEIRLAAAVCKHCGKDVGAAPAKVDVPKWKASVIDPVDAWERSKSGG